MRSAHSLDGRHFAIQDGFGLTRVTAPSKAKTERKISAGLDPLLSMDPTRTQLLAWRQRWDSMHHLSLPELKPLTKIDRFQLSQSVLGPEGFVEIRSHYGSEPATTARRWTDPTTGAEAVDIASLEAPTREGIRSEHAAAQAIWSPLRSASSGVWAVAWGAPATLYVGDLSARPVRLRWRAPVEVAADECVTLHPFDDGRVVLCAFSPRRLEARLARFGVDGRTERVVTLPSLAPPAVLTPSSVLHQTGPSTLYCSEMDREDPLRFELAEAHRGVARPFGEGSAMYVLPWHAESIIELRSSAEISRRLSEPDAHVRRFMREQVARANALGNPGGMLFELMALDVNPARSEFGFGWDSTRGDGSLSGFLASGWLSALTDDEALQNLQGWRWNVGGGLSPSRPASPWGSREVDAAFAALESAGVSLIEALHCLPDAYDFWGDGELPRHAAFTPDGAQSFLAGMCFAMRTRRAEGLRAAAGEGREALSAARVVEALRGLPALRPNRVGYRVLDLLCAVSVNALGVEAAAVIEGLQLVRPPWRSGVGSLLEGSVRWLVSASPEPGATAARLRAGTASIEGVSIYVQRALSTLGF